MDAIQRQLLNAKKKDLERQQLAAERGTKILRRGRKKGDEIIESGGKRGKEIIGTGKERSENIIKSGSQRGQDILEAGRKRGEEILGATDAEPDELNVDEQQEAGAKLYKEQIAGKRAEAGVAGEAAVAAKTEIGEGQEEGSIKGLWNKLQKMKEEARKDEVQKVTSQQAFQALQKQAQELVRQGWSAVHETVEDLALSFVDLTILTGPLCGLVLFIRILGFAIWPPISVKGVEVSLFPWFSLPGDFARVKSLLALIISFIFWTIIIAIIYAFNNPLSTLAKIIGL